MAARKLEIWLADTCGFCMGVQRAVRMVLDASQDPATALPIRTPGPLIHNEQVLEVLHRQGVLEMGEDGQETGGTAVIRAHGLPLTRRRDLGRRYERLLDATCPHVARVQDLMQRYAGEGYLCVVVGDRGHAEVDGVLSYAGQQGRVVAGPEEVDRLPEAEKVAVVAQTTQDEQLFGRTVAALRARYGECLVFDTVCRATARRQADVRELAGRVDAMVVVGSRKSANTRRLAQISAASGTPTFHVETEQDLDVERILQCRRVGLTAGASTPHWMIRRVILHLEREHRRRNRPLVHWLRQAVGAIVFTNLYAAGAVAALTYAMAHLLPGVPLALGLCMGVSFCFVLAQQLLNQYARRESLYLSEPARADFFMAHERLLLLTGAVAWALALLLAAYLGLWVFLLVVVGSLGGLMYQLPFPPPLAGRLGLRSLQRLPASKEVFVGLAWGALAAGVPALVAEGPWRAAAFAFAATFLMAFQRTLAMDLRDVEADQLVGPEALVRLLGPGAGSGLLVVLVVLQAVLLLGGGLLGWTTSLSYLLVLGMAYALACFTTMERHRMEEDTAELVVEGQFYLMGLAALLWAAG